MRRFAPALVSGLALALLFALGCEPKKPAKLTLDPKGPFKMTRVGQTERVKPAAYDDKNRPFVQALDVRYASSDESVAKVAPDGTITSTGSGVATITAEAQGVKTTAEVHVTVVGSVEIVGDPPSRLKYGGKDYQLQVVVKDDKGRPIEDAKVYYEATDYCVEVSPEGLVHPLTVGKCSVVAKSGDQSASHEFDVR